MSCEKYRELFDSVFDKEIKDSRKKKLFAHLEACPECSLQFKLYEKVISGIENIEEVEPPPELTAVVMKGIEAAGRPWETPAPWFVPTFTNWAWAGAFAVVLLATVYSFIGWDSHPIQVAKQPAAPAANTIRDEAPVLAQDRTRDDLVSEASTATPSKLDTGILLVRHEGDVQVFDLTTSSWIPVDEQALLPFGTRVRTGVDGVASMEYQKEKVKLRVKPGSALQVLDNQTLRVFAGSAWVVVKRKGTIFRTETPNAIASVRGTRYTVEVTPMTDLYRDQGLKVFSDYVAQGLKTPINPGPTTDLALYSAQMGLAMTRTLSAVDLFDKITSEVKVFESVVNVVAKNARGQETGNIDLEEGFKAKIVLASLSKPTVLSENDFLGWKGVMVFDQDLIARARAKIAPPAGATSAGAPPGPASVSTGAGGPVSESGRSGFEDVKNR